MTYTPKQLQWLAAFQQILVDRLPDTDDETFNQLSMLERVIQSTGKVPVDDPQMMQRLSKAMEFFQNHALHLGGFPSEG